MFRGVNVRIVGFITHITVQVRAHDLKNVARSSLQLVYDRSAHICGAP